MTKYGYARVSTIAQSLEEQTRALNAEGCTTLYAEKFTGTTKDRAEFTALLSVVEDGDTIVVTKLDRFARSASDAINIIRDLFDRGVRVHVLNMGVVENTSMGRLMLTMLAGFAEFERDMIVERTQTGRAIARQREGYRDGRKPKYSRKQLDHALKLKETHSFTQVAEITGISIATLKRESARRKASEG
ncbi:MAG: recombinase family protein [Kurthia sp.]|nr:recombinase family protein [Candidatus Kurthia equi]